MYNKIGFIGLGLIGGSIARTIKRIHPDISLVAVNHSHKSIEMANEEGVIDNDITFTIDKMNDCDIIFLCAPIKNNIDYLQPLKSIINSDCIITDVGSVKSEMEEAVVCSGLEQQFIGGHPMCGSEKTGYDNSSDRLLENAYYLLTNNNKVDIVRFNEFKKFISSIGAIPLEMTPDEHDYATGGISHIPHIIASSLVNFVMKNDSNSNMKTIAAGGFRDITRIASASPIMWQNICLTNRDKILELLEEYNKELLIFREAIKESDSDTIYKLFEDAKEYRDSINTGKGLIENVYEFYLDLEDEAGGIARVATILADVNLNIKNIGIINNREYVNGVLRIEMYDEFSMFKAINELRAKKYRIYA